MISRNTFMTLLAVAASTPRVLADFWLYSVQQNDIVDSSGGGFQTGFLQAFPGPPSCEDVEDYDSLPAQGLNDASSSGYACDGCYGIDLAAWEWPIERLEMYNGDDLPFFSQATGSITLREDEYGWFQYAEDNTIWGQCFKMDSLVDDFNCAAGALGARSGVKLFECWGDLEARRLDG